MSDLRDPDWDRLRELGDEVTRLQDAGTWSKGDYERLKPEVETASGGHGEFQEFLLNAADPDWLG